MQGHPRQENRYAFHFTSPIAKQVGHFDRSRQTSYVLGQSLAVAFGSSSTPRQIGLGIAHARYFLISSRYSSLPLTTVGPGKQRTLRSCSARAQVAVRFSSLDSQFLNKPFPRCSSAGTALSGNFGGCPGTNSCGSALHAPSTTSEITVAAIFSFVIEFFPPFTIVRFAGSELPNPLTHRPEAM